MKKLILSIYTLIMVCGFCTFAQQNPNSNTELIDAFNPTINTNFDNFKNKVFNKSLLNCTSSQCNTYKSYDTLGNLKEILNITYDAANNTLIANSKKRQQDIWMYDYTSTFTYNSEGNLLLFLEETWRNNEWEKYQYTYTFDLNQNMLSEQYEWYQNKNWYNSYKKLYTYNIDNKIDYVIECDWINNKWEENIVETFSYDSIGNLREKLRKFANHKSDYISRYTYTYDTIGNELTELYENYYKSKWIKVLYNEFSYDIKGNLTSKLRENWHNNACQSWEKRTYAYDSNNNKIADTYKYWFPNWNGATFTTHTFDASNNLITDLYSYWENNKWKISERSLYTYDSLRNALTGKCEKYLNEKWFPAENTLWIISNGKICEDFQRSYRYEISQTPIFPQLKYINTFPNPSKGKFFIDINDFITKPFNLKIINSKNQIVYQLDDTWDSKLFVNLPNLAPSLYFIYITINGKAYTEKIIVN